MSNRVKVESQEPVQLTLETIAIAGHAAQRVDNGFSFHREG